MRRVLGILWFALDFFESEYQSAWYETYIISYIESVILYCINLIIMDFPAFRPILMTTTLRHVCSLEDSWLLAPVFLRIQKSRIRELVLSYKAFKKPVYFAFVIKRRPACKLKPRNVSNQWNRTFYRFKSNFTAVLEKRQ